MLFRFLKYFFFISVVLSSCTIVRKYQKDKPFVFSSNDIEINGGDFSTDERNVLKLKLYALQDDSVKPRIKDILFVIHSIKEPPVYDSGYAAISARNMEASFIHLGYYSAKAKFDADTLKYEKQQRVKIKYTINTGPVTRIDTMAFSFKKPDMQQLALSTKEQSYLKKPNPVTKLDVLGEVSRLVDLYRNNGYYKITPDDIKVLGDTTIEALTNISDDPFENLQKLAEAARKRDSPTIKLALIQNPNADSNRVKKYYIDSIIIYPDFSGNDLYTAYTEDTLRGNNIVRWHNYRDKIVKKYLLINNLAIKRDSLYSQEKYNKTISNFSRLGVWQNVNIEVKEKSKNDSTGKVDMILQLVPAKKYGFESNIEASYSTNSNSNNVNVANSGNLLGFSGNVSIQDRNAWKQGIRTTLALRAGVELNLNATRNSGKRINSSEISSSYTISLPKLIFPFRSFNRKDFFSKQSFVSLSASGTNRISLFKLFSLGISTGNEWSKKANQSLLFRTVNIEYSNLYDRTELFNNTLAANPFLRYSYNTALVIGSSGRFSRTISKRSGKIFTYTINGEESGFIFLPLSMENFGKKDAKIPFIPIPVWLDGFGIFNKDLKKFVKGDIELTWTKTKLKSVSVIRFFVGIGTPFGTKDTTLPFFKQYFAGGPNSMRGWPIRGIGPGSKAPFGYDARFLSDRTGDIRIEANYEYRFPLMQIIPNTLDLKGAWFVDAGNVWNSRNTFADRRYDSSQFNIKNLYKQLGLNAGFGLRFDFNYIVLRADFGFRFKRPELTKNGGWKAPSIGFDDVFKKIFAKGPNEEYRKWRYENFNFTIGLNYPF